MPTLIWTHSLMAAILVVALLLGLWLVRSCMGLARRWGAVDYPRVQLAGCPAVPRLGGLAVFAAAVLTIAVFWLFFPLVQNILAQQADRLTGFFIGALAILVIGLIDDIRGLRARWKLIGQLGVAVFIYWWGLRVEVVTNVFDHAQPLELGILAFPLNVIWVVLAMNAMNIIDGLDGLAGGVFLLALILLSAASFLGDNLYLAPILAALIGSTAAYLRYNYFQGSIYLGDGGSLFMGYCLAAFVPLFAPKSAGMAAAVIPMAVLSVPIAEVGVTALRRIWKGHPVGLPDAGHAHYRLVQGGMNKRQAVLFIQALSFLCGLAALSMTFIFHREMAYLMGAVWLALVAVFLKVGYLPKNQERETNCTRYTRSPIFMDFERLLRKKIWRLSNVKNRRELREGLAEMAVILRLEYLELTLDHHGEVLVLSTKDVEDPASQPSLVTLTLNHSFENGMSCRTKARVNYHGGGGEWQGLPGLLAMVAEAACHAATHAPILESASPAKAAVGDHSV